LLGGREEQARRKRKNGTTTSERIESPGERGCCQKTAPQKKEAEFLTPEGKGKSGLAKKNIFFDLRKKEASRGGRVILEDLNLQYVTGGGRRLSL